MGQTEKDVTINPELPSDQRAELIALLEEYAHMFSDKPGVTDLVEGKVRLPSEEPVHTKSYTIPYAMRETINAKVRDLTGNGSD